MIQRFADWLAYDVFRLDPTSHLGGAVDFFIYDSFKILLLLFAISVVMSISGLPVRESVSSPNSSNT